MRHSRILAVTLLTFLGACQKPSPAAELPPADIAAIRATSAKWLAAVQQGRWDDAAATYTDDAILWFPNAAFKGRAAILKSFQSNQPMSTLDLHIDEIHGHGDIAFVSGYSTVTAPGAAPIVRGHYLDVRLRQPDGTWLFYRDMVSPVPPPNPR